MKYENRKKGLIPINSLPPVREATKLEMETRIDFVRWLDIDVVLKILMCLNDPADLIRASAQLCTKTFPQLASITHVTEPSDNSDDPSGGTSEDSIFRREHRAYASLFQAVASFPARFCIASPVSASSTDNYPEESIVNTLDSRDQILVRASYWSSKGHDDPELPETLIYKLNANFCPCSKWGLQSTHQDLCDSEWVILNRDFLDSQEDANDKFVWTYTSQTFPMAQENRVQWFKLPEPVLCIGGFLQIDVAHVQAIGCQLSPAFSVDISEPSNTISLEYNSKEFMRISQDPSALGTNLLPVQPPRGFIWENLQEFVDMIQLQQNVMEFAWINDDFEMDEFDPVALMM
ncbi:hypothetical protein Ccrd_006826 [Cynara cardunculus var. scolymus]|uniref:F-box domain, cyclin-like protein n=1 Tax=Cynara cardunculus var. scolymus TaxID=59895 RepID=A0A118JTX4_CYNCS|nr:hypothetical protein Ccrd_006826 [Cynara cardunculus var. scolymus]